MKIISCFSYKGGAGRSTLAINVIPFLANELGASAEHPLILVDMDIDSCGLTFLYDLADNVHAQYNVQHLFGDGVIPTEDKPVDRHNLFTHMEPVGEIYKRNATDILCLPAMPSNSLGGQSNNYDGDPDRFEKFLKECKKVGCCGVLLDSAVGDQLTALWSNKYASHIMCCMRPTKQFREGTKRFFDQFDDEYDGKKVIVIPNVVPTEEVTLYNDGVAVRYPDYAKEQILEAFGENVERDYNIYIMDMVEGEHFGVPKIDRFMWHESILDNLPMEELTDCEKLALKRYKDIAAIIAGEN